MVSIIEGKIVTGRIMRRHMAYPGKLVDAILTEDERRSKVETWLIDPYSYNIAIISDRAKELSEIMEEIFRSAV